MTNTVKTDSQQYWVKVVDMPQRCSALIDASECGSVIYFVNDAIGVSDQFAFAQVQAAKASLPENGFRRFANDSQARFLLKLLSHPYYPHPHPNGPIYSSGRFGKGLPTQ